MGPEAEITLTAKSSGIGFTSADGDSTTVANTVANGDIVYTPKADFFGTDTFDYTVSTIINGDPNFSSATVTITINPINDSPEVRPDFGTTASDDATVTIKVLANDEDVDGDTLTITSVGSPTKGTVSFAQVDTMTLGGTSVSGRFDAQAGHRAGGICLDRREDFLGDFAGRCAVAFFANIFEMDVGQGSRQGLAAKEGGAYIDRAVVNIEIFDNQIGAFACFGGLASACLPVSRRVAGLGIFHL